MRWATKFWDGRAATLEEQALGPIEALVEMAMPLEQALERIAEFDIYAELFHAAYPDDDDDPVHADKVALALAAFQRTLNRPHSPLDLWLVGDEGAMT